MNIWEFIGKPADWRPREKTVQKVKHFDEVPASKKKYPMFAQVKKDGVYCLIVTKADGTKGYFGRTGLQLTSMENVPPINSPKSSVVITELCCDLCSLEQLSGVVNPNRVNELDEKQQEIANNMYFAVHDLLYPAALINGSTDCNYSNRHFEASMYMPKELLPYELVHNEKGAKAFKDKCIAAGEEGAVFKQETGWEAGHKGWRMMKDVREVRYDLLCTGWEEGSGKYAGKVANLLFQWEGKPDVVKAMLGIGYTHDHATLLYQAVTGVSSAEGLNPVGKIFEVYGLSDSSKGRIRLPKVGQYRHDKEQPDS